MLGQQQNSRPPKRKGGMVVGYLCLLLLLELRCCFVVLTLPEATGNGIKENAVRMCAYIVYILYAQNFHLINTYLIWLHNWRGWGEAPSVCRVRANTFSEQHDTCSLSVSLANNTKTPPEPPRKHDGICIFTGHQTHIIS